MDTSNKIGTNPSVQTHSSIPRAVEAQLIRTQNDLNNIAKKLHKFENNDLIDDEQFMALACTWSLLDSELSPKNPDITATNIRKTAIQIKKFSQDVLALTKPKTTEVDTAKPLEKPRTTGLSLASQRLNTIEGGPVGFKNMGASCYLNSAVQTLFNISEVRDMINRDGPKAKKEEELLLTLYALLNIKKESESEPLLRKLRTILLRKGLDKGRNPTGQKDAHEVVNIILAALQWSPMEIGNRYQSIKNPSLNRLSDRQPTYEIQIELKDSKDAANFQDVIDSHFQDEIMPIEAHVTMNEEEVYNLKKTPVIINSPSHLVVLLKRFENVNEVSRKVTTPVRFPENKTVLLTCGNKKIPYEIVGYTNHIGSTMGSGHYTANVKNCQDPEGQKRWVKCNDSDVREMAPKNISRAAYLVVLKRKDS